MKFLTADSYQNKCQTLFELYSDKIKRLLPGARVEHIGSSSIPNAISKGDLDIFVGVDIDDLEASIPLLMTLGFREKLDTFRCPELCMLQAESEDVAIQAVANGSQFEDPRTQ